VIVIPDAELDRFLAEDLPHGDLTTRSLELGGRPARMDFRAGGVMVACCGEEAARLLERLGCRVEVAAPSGTRCGAGQALLSAHGPAEAVLAGWKVAQTLMEYASGIATAARTMVDAARAASPGAVIACTRKAFPGTRAVAVKAVVAGGAVPHRLGLSDTILLFPEHRALLGGGGMAAAVARLRAACPEKKVVVEVATLAEALEAGAAGADVIQLEKFPPELVAEAAAGLARTGGGALLAAAGGVNAANAARYAGAGARILVTSAPYWAAPADVKVGIGPA
jgi:molybdenum transport protein